MIEISPEEYPMLSRIDAPADLRKFTIAELTQLCADMRKFLIRSLAVNPGHFASSMGAVELTVALHYVFNTPFDRIVWDVGHQAYGHKLLTGRARNFDTNRKLGGLSGFPNPDESPYDTFTAGHASNSISAALGMAVATSLKGEDPQRHVVAVIGDASISGGLAFEGLNNAANSASNLLIILNDNDMSIDRNVGSLNSYLTRLNTSKTYNNLRYKAYKVLRKLRLVSDHSRHSILRFNNSLKALIAREQNIFEGLNIRYFGPFDGHDLERMIRVLTDIKDMDGPKILHLRTIKGKGYAPAEADPSTWHAPGKFDPVTGERPKSVDAGKPRKYQDVFGETLVELARDNDRIVAVTAAMPSGTSVNMMQEAFPARTFDVGISEGHAVTFSGGMAKEGLLPYCAIYSSFLQRGYDHIIHDVAIQRLPVTFCIDRAGIVGEDGVTHHGLFDIAYMRTIPGMTVAVPRDERMLRNLLYTAQSDPQGPMAIRYPRGAGSLADWRTPMNTLSRGAGELLTSVGAAKADAVILAVGPLALRAVEVASKLREEGLCVAVYDMVFVKPLDCNILSEVGVSDVPVITLEDGVKAGGMGSAVAEWMAANGHTPHITMLGTPDEFIAQGTVAELHKLAGLDAESIAQAVRDAVKTKTETR
ncbi:MAG: 1-deoxy-D-xylulose-5-phosphate synthase [Candidatus Amulumruptor caecigallinarius]|nr:1-deoxy-D-xylulose-5-phosphate synthase [Candidatus Amulumruptor caecigallinarius]MCM1397331.1 1-deoxy-D-xylulose-5-phosphate synthase [Candidatus Amulumruptor caecigallinarius]MCM1453605.1 1-deoxy-D-xylulose-5-phosphate synthase [bacterium]